MSIQNLQETLCTRALYVLPEKHCNNEIRRLERTSAVAMEEERQERQEKKVYQLTEADNERIRRKERENAR